MPCWSNLQSPKELHIGVLSVLLNGFLIAQAKPLLDE